MIVLGSTTINQYYSYLAGRLYVPLINPGLVSFKIAKLMVELGLRQSKRTCYPPLKIRDEVIRAMGDVAKKYPCP